MKTLLIGSSALAFLALSPLPSAFGRAPANVPAPLAILSDVDDTVRPTGILHPARGLEVALGIKKVRAFSGMPELYRQLLLAAGSDPVKDEYFVSGSPLTLSFALAPFLRENSFSTENVSIRVGGPIRDIADYKQDQFKKILTKNPKTPFLFLGDDTEKDALALAYAKGHFPDQVAGLYIHTIEGVRPAIPDKGEIPYFTAVEVALHELKKKHLKPEQIGLVAQAMLDDDQFDEDVVPSYAKLCPEEGWILKLMLDLQLSLPDATMDQLSEIQTRVHAICTPERKSAD